MSTIVRLSAAAAIGAALVSAPAHAVQFGFYNITHGNAAAEADGEANLLVDVLDLGGGSVRFHFSNASASSITDVYFDDGTLLNLATISSSAGVSYSQGAAPPNLPGANGASPAFQVTAGFLADSDAPVSHNGVSNGEWLNIDFTLKGGKTYQDTLDALALPNGGGTGDLRIGVHVQGYAGGASESFINNVTPVPEPASLGMMFGGAALVLAASRRRGAR